MCIVVFSSSPLRAFGHINKECPLFVPSGVEQIDLVAFVETATAARFINLLQAGPAQTLFEGIGRPPLAYGQDDEGSFELAFKAASRNLRAHYLDSWRTDLVAYGYQTKIEPMCWNYYQRMATQNHVVAKRA